MLDEVRKSLETSPIVKKEEYIYCNTVQHRLRKVQEITGLNAAVLPDSYTLYVAAALHRISQVHGE